MVGILLSRFSRRHADTLQSSYGNRSALYGTPVLVLSLIFIVLGFSFLGVAVLVG
jgi:hypothetical protein